MLGEEARKALSDGCKVRDGVSPLIHLEIPISVFHKRKPCPV